MIGVATTGSSSDYAEFVDRHGVTFPSFDDTFGVVFDSFGIPSTPAMVAIALDGSTEGLFGAADDAIIEMLVANARS